MQILIVHCIDTEGPLFEPFDATFEIIRKVTGIELAPTVENLEKIRRGDGVPPEKLEIINELVSHKRLNYNKDWKEIDCMLDDLLSQNFRNRYKDDFGNGYLFNWFIMDHVGYRYNPRRRILGYNEIHNHYADKLTETGSDKDGVYWHFHPVSFTREANKVSNNFHYTNEHLQVLSRRVIDAGYFPSAFRPGLDTERIDIHLFLEQWIPFDYGNQGVSGERLKKLKEQKDLMDGRYGDWRNAPSEWGVYHPDIYDYQKKGDLKRYIARCLYISGRGDTLDEGDIESAFKIAASGKKVIVAGTHHDWRDIRPDIEYFYDLIRTVQKRYPDVKIKHCNAVDAIRESEGLTLEEPIKFVIGTEGNLFFVEADKPVWGVQPYFCFKTQYGEYIHENLNALGKNKWGYVFDEDTLPMELIECFGVAANDNFGNTTVVRFSPLNNRTIESYLNAVKTD